MKLGEISPAEIVVATRRFGLIETFSRPFNWKPAPELMLPANVQGPFLKTVGTVMLMPISRELGPRLCGDRLRCRLNVVRSEHLENEFPSDLPHRVDLGLNKLRQFVAMIRRHGMRERDRDLHLLLLAGRSGPNVIARRGSPEGLALERARPLKRTWGLGSRNPVSPMAALPGSDPQHLPLDSVVRFFA